MSTIANTTHLLSPRSGSGAFGWSILAHVLVFASVVTVVHINWTKEEPVMDYVELGYEELDAPPAPPKIIVRNEPKEIQDEKSEIAGTQKVQKESAVGNADGSETSVVPYYKIKPTYPRAALLSGAEGYVLFKFDVNEKGEAENIEVLGGEKLNLFEREAERALTKWRYKPFLDSNGLPRRSLNHKAQVTFKMDNTETM